MKFKTNIPQKYSAALLAALPQGVKITQILNYKEHRGEINILFKTEDNIEINRTYRIKVDEANLSYTFVEADPCRTPMSFLKASEDSCRKQLVKSDLSQDARHRIESELNRVLVAIQKQREINQDRVNRSKNNLVKQDQMIELIRKLCAAKKKVRIFFDGKIYKFEGFSEEVNEPKSRKRHYIYVSNDKGDTYKIHLLQVEKIF
jgi:hypothetical protein